MKKAIIFFILFTFLYFSIGYFPFFLIKQQVIRYEIKQKIRNNPSLSELTELIFNKSTFASLTWKEDNEFSYNNHMFDVVSIVSGKNNTIHIFCIDDIKENTLITQLFELRKANEKNQSNGKEFFLKFFVKDYLKEKPISFISYYVDFIHFIYKKDIYISYISNKPGPPPKMG